jgi:hypothetical protein
MNEEATIRVRRRWNWMNALGKISLFVNDKTIGAVGNGKEELFKLPPGDHTIVYTGSGWSKNGKIAVSLAPGEIKTFECGITVQSWLVFIIYLFVLTLFWHSLTSVWLRVVLLFALLGLAVAMFSHNDYYLIEVRDPK